MSESRGRAFRLILLFGVVSLFADLTYEGARSIAGPFLGLLGAGAVAVAAVAGAGELLGYGVRLLSGRWVDRTRHYWGFALAGYAVNLLAVPALALAGRWEVAAGLLLLERIGKGIRSPAKDTLLSIPAAEVGTGWGFGVHEAMDQIGAVAGPLLVAAILASSGSHRTAFGSLLLPALAALAVLAFLWRRNAELAARGREAPAEGRPAGEAAADFPPPGPSALPRAFWVYLAGACLLAAGLADFPLAAYHFQRTGLFSEARIPLTYALAMGVDAVAALALGKLFDRAGGRTLALAALLTAGSAPLVFLGGPGLALLGLGLWGIGMAAQESVMRAAVAELVPPALRGTGFGLFGAAFGVCWLAGSLAMGLLYEGSRPWLAGLAAGLQLASVPFFLSVRLER